MSLLTLTRVLDLLVNILLLCKLEAKEPVQYQPLVLCNTIRRDHHFCSFELDWTGV